MKTLQNFTKTGLVAALAALSLAFGVSAASADVITWHSATVNTSVSYYASVAYGDGHFVAINRQGDVVSSTDGITWNEPSTALNGNYFTDITFGDGKFVAVGDNNVAVSTDGGATWDFDTSAFTNYYYHVTFGNGTFVAAEGDNCYGNAAYSTDGINWSEVSTASTNVCWQNVAFGDGKFVLVSDVGIDVSTDNGQSWTNVHTNSDPSYQGLRSVGYGNGKWIALGLPYSNPGADAIVYTSTDATNWTETASVPVVKDSTWNGVEYFSGTWIAYSQTNTSGAINLAVSTDDGATWTGSNYDGYGIYGMASDGTQLVYVGEYTGSTVPTGRTDSSIAYTNVPSAVTPPTELAATGVDGSMAGVYALFGLLLVGAGTMVLRRK